MTRPHPHDLLDPAELDAQDRDLDMWDQMHGPSPEARARGGDLTMANWKQRFEDLLVEHGKALESWERQRERLESEAAAELERMADEIRAEAGDAGNGWRANETYRAQKIFTKLRERAAAIRALRGGARCPAHGKPRCPTCSLNPSTCAPNGGGCEFYSRGGMHWDTCRNRVLRVEGDIWVLKTGERVPAKPANGGA